MTHLFSRAAKAALLLALITVTSGLLSAQPRCFIFQLQGSYAFVGSGSATPIGQITMIGVQTFDGQGNFTLTETASFGGTIVPSSLSGKYTVNVDCTGTATTKFPDGSTGRLSFVVADNGKTIYAMEADTGVNLSIVFTKQ